MPKNEVTRNRTTKQTVGTMRELMVVVSSEEKEMATSSLNIARGSPKPLRIIRGSPRPLSITKGSPMHLRVTKGSPRAKKRLAIGFSSSDESSHSDPDVSDHIHKNLESKSKKKNHKLKPKINSPAKDITETSRQNQLTPKQSKAEKLSDGQIEALLNESLSSLCEVSSDSGEDMWTVASHLISPGSLKKADQNHSSPMKKTPKKNLTVSPIKLRRKVQSEGLKSPSRSPLKAIAEGSMNVPPVSPSLRNRSELKKPARIAGDDFVKYSSPRKGRQSPRPHRSPPKTPKTPSLRRQVLEATTPKSVNKTPTRTRATLRSESIPEGEFNDSVDFVTPLKTPVLKSTTPDSTRKSARKRLTLTPSKVTPIKGTPSTPSSVKRVGHGFLTPVVAERSSRISGTSRSELDRVRVQLHVSTVPSSLPCREKEFQNVQAFILRKIEDQAGGCMYISGVPGTGKTATVHAVVRDLQQNAHDRLISSFDFVEVNGLRLTEPRQAYVRILQAITGEKLTAEQAHGSLEKKFSGKNKRTTVLLVDEVDYLCNRRQDVIYNLLEWTTKRSSKLVVLTIANTMDLPERTLKGKVTSRMGLTRLVFQPYTYQQLQLIVSNRLSGTSSFHPDAVQLVARKVAAVSGDARRALDICRRATELVESDSDSVSLIHVEKALSQIFSGARVLAIRSCSKIWQLVLRAMRDETNRTGVEETNVGQVYVHLKSICAFESCPPPTVGQVLIICSGLERFGLIIAEKGRTDLERKLSLNVSSDDIHYALSC